MGYRNGVLSSFEHLTKIINKF